MKTAAEYCIGSPKMLCRCYSHAQFPLPYIGIKESPMSVIMSVLPHVLYGRSHGLGQAFCQGQVFPFIL